jgi:glutathione synthase/RimK-type ligase-like ATP-grasp enzyme
VSRIVGIYREPEYSPGRHRSNDALLLEQIGHELRLRAAEVELVTFDEVIARRPEASLVFSMCQGPASLAALAEWEQAGARIVNSPAAAINTYRDHLPMLLSRAGVPFPETRLVSTSTLDWRTVAVDRPLWLKRGDVHASISSDVQRIDTQGMLREGLTEFVSRGITHAALQEHRAGSEIKFYGVAGGSFFHWFFTNEAGEAGQVRLQSSSLQQLGERAARAAGLDVFGGDIIVDRSGGLTLIDLNDWPSFAPCRDAASEAIAEFLMRRVDASWNAGLVPSANPSAV